MLLVFNIKNQFYLLVNKSWFILLIITSSALTLNAQQTKIDSLNKVLLRTFTDTGNILVYEQLGETYRAAKKMDSAIISFKKALQLNEKGDYWPIRQCWDIASLDYILYEMGDYLESLRFAKKHVDISRKINDTIQEGLAHLVFGHNYRELGEFKQSLAHYFKAKAILKLYWVSRKKPEDNTFTILCIGQTYIKMKNIDSAFKNVKEGHKRAISDSAGTLILLATRLYGDIYAELNDDETALQYYWQYIPDYIKYKERNRDLGFVLNSIANIYQKKNKIDSAVYYAKRAFENAFYYHDQENLFKAASTLSDFYKNKNESIAFNYFKVAVKAKDSMTKYEKLRDLQVLLFNEQILEKKQKEKELKEAAQRKLQIIISAILISIISILIWFRIRQLQIRYKTILEQNESEKLKAKYEKKLLELEAKALRAQMNPHFIYNCLNSIKALIQAEEKEKATDYLTTFSKLIRTLFQNSDKRQISLFDEIETCKLYTQLEQMRFGNKLNVRFQINPDLDLKSVSVPALIIQPFIENAIWHGIMPKSEGGSILIMILGDENSITCEIEDDGIGRERSEINKPKERISYHESKGVALIKSRLDLSNSLDSKNTTIEIIDKKDADGISTGTKVILKFTEY